MVRTVQRLKWFRWVLVLLFFQWTANADENCAERQNLLSVNKWMLSNASKSSMAVKSHKSNPVDIPLLTVPFFVFRDGISIEFTNRKAGVNNFSDEEIEISQDPECLISETLLSSDCIVAQVSYDTLFSHETVLRSFEINSSAELVLWSLITRCPSNQEEKRPSPKFYKKLRFPLTTNNQERVGLYVYRHDSLELYQNIKYSHDVLCVFGAGDVTSEYLQRLESRLKGRRDVEILTALPSQSELVSTWTLSDTMHPTVYGGIMGANEFVTPWCHLNGKVYRLLFYAATMIMAKTDQLSVTVDIIFVDDKDKVLLLFQHNGVLGVEESNCAEESHDCLVPDSFSVQIPTETRSVRALMRYELHSINRKQKDAPYDFLVHDPLFTAFGTAARTLPELQNENILKVEKKYTSGTIPSPGVPKSDTSGTLPSSGVPKSDTSGTLPSSESQKTVFVACSVVILCSVVVGAVFLIAVQTNSNIPRHHENEHELQISSLNTPMNDFPPITDCNTREE